MKSVRYFCIGIALASVFIISSCKDNGGEESSWEEISFTSKYTGDTRQAGVYLPAGYSKNKTYPVIYMPDGLVFTDGTYREALDSLIRYDVIEPVIVACSYENKMHVPGYQMAYRNAEYVELLGEQDDALKKLFDAHMDFFTKEFIPAIEKDYPVSKNREDRIFYGTSNSADFGLTLSFRNQSLFSEYWCFSPVFSDISRYGMLDEKTSYRICWGAKEEINASFDYFPSMVKDIRKRDGSVRSWVFEGGHERPIWESEFIKLVSERFAK